MLHHAIAAGVVFAQEESEPSSGFTPILWLLLIGVAVYLLFGGPQRRRMKAVRREQQDMRDSLEFGDQIVTVGGIFGRVTSTSDDDVVIDIGGGTEMRLAKRAIAERLGEDTE